MYLKNKADTEDAVQHIFMKAWEKKVFFQDEHYEQAWFVTVAKNHCKDVLKSHWKKKRVDIEVEEEWQIRLEMDGGRR